MARQLRSGRKYRSVAIDDLPWDIGEYPTRQMETSRNSIIEQLFAWWLRLPGAKLPERPDPELMKKLIDAWQRRQETIRATAYTMPCAECGVQQGPCITAERKLITETIHKPRLEAATKRVDETLGDTLLDALPETGTAGS
ncbi:hypothetical protein SAMN05443665_101768 [Actinomadura meyerae]|uniref:Uncharacterized protein n=1 Tax=Actinomadura meyerae TaxID=240840 RepID=A0A239K9B0_9ACTN|nr:hypothetical protein [Actinomadura meyerae]SNT14695.1 hypothetical protein SAMN05443665_101768 [Actinomadura meyerae]